MKFLKIYGFLMKILEIYDFFVMKFTIIYIVDSFCYRPL